MKDLGNKTRGWKDRYIIKQVEQGANGRIQEVGFQGSQRSFLSFTVHWKMFIKNVEGRKSGRAGAGGGVAEQSPEPSVTMARKGTGHTGIDFLSDLTWK